MAATGDDVLVGQFRGRLGPWLRGRARFSPATTSRRSSGGLQSRETTFDSDIGDVHELEEILRRLAGEGRYGLGATSGAGNIAIKVRLDDFSTVTRARTIARPRTTPARWRRSRGSASRLRAATGPVRLLGVRGRVQVARTQTQLALEL